MLSLLDDYDWEQAFAMASSKINPVINYTGSLSPFDREDVDTIIAMDSGENDGNPWVGIFKLKDGRYVYLEAGCDYTGWDCQAGGSSWISDDLDHLWQFGTSHDSQNRLGDYLVERLAGLT